MRLILGHRVALDTHNRTITAHIDEIEAKKNVKVDGIYFLHNHPNAQPAFSDADKTVSRSALKTWGALYKGSIIINSGKYAHTNRSVTGKSIEFNDLVQLPSDMVGWDTTQPHLDSGIIPGDPLYEGMRPEAIEEFQRLYPSIDALKVMDTWSPTFVADRESPDVTRSATEAIAGLGKYFKTQEGWTTFVGTSITGQVISAFELTGVAELAKHRNELREVITAVSDSMGAHRVHIIAHDPNMADIFEEVLFQQGTQNGLMEGVASAWVDGNPIGKVIAEPFADIFPIPNTDPSDVHDRV